MVLQALTTSSPVNSAPSNTSELNDRSPMLDKRARRRFITASRFKASSPVMRYTGSRDRLFFESVMSLFYRSVFTLIWFLANLHATSPCSSVRTTALPARSRASTVDAAGCP